MEGWVHPRWSWYGQEGSGEPKGVDAPWGTVGFPESRNGQPSENFPLRLPSQAILLQGKPKSKQPSHCLDPQCPDHPLSPPDDECPPFLLDAVYPL